MALFCNILIIPFSIKLGYNTMYDLMSHGLNMQKKLKHTDLEAYLLYSLCIVF